MEQNGTAKQASKDFIMSLVVDVRTEIEGRRKSLEVTDEQLVEKVLARIEEEGCIFSDNKAESKHYEDVAREVVWNYANATEAACIVSRLKSGDRSFAKGFFYGTNKDKCNVSRFRSKIIAQIKQAYHYDMSIEEFGNIVYSHLWDNGTWRVLDNYARESSFFCWLEQVARHEVMRVLEEMNVINVSRERTAGNTRLLGTSVSPEVWNLIIADFMPEGEEKDLLLALYVDRKRDEMMMKDFDMDAETLRGEVKKSERMLKNRLVCDEGHYQELVLKDKSPRRIKVSEDFVWEFVKWQEERSEASPLADIFGINMGKEELNGKVVSFLYDFSEKLHWSDEDKLIWRLRFIENSAPADVAERCGKARAWLDTRYSRLNKKFNAAIREWWKNNS